LCIYIADAHACLWNYGVDDTHNFVPSLGAGQIMDDSSSAFVACASYIQNYPSFSFDASCQICFFYSIQSATAVIVAILALLF